MAKIEELLATIQFTRLMQEFRATFGEEPVLRNMALILVLTAARDGGRLTLDAMGPDDRPLGTITVEPTPYAIAEVASKIG
jgi:hypothetical protein